MKTKDYFIKPRSTAQTHYEALRDHFVNGLKIEEAANKFGLAPSYLMKLRFEFQRGLEQGRDRFFSAPKKGPRKRSTDQRIVDLIVSLRKQNHSIQDIKAFLDAQGTNISLDTIDKILKSEGFAPLPKRSVKERMAAVVPPKIEAPICAPLEFCDENFFTENGAGPLVFLPLIERLGIVPAIKSSGFAGTSVLSDVSSVMSLLCLKLLGNERYSHDGSFNMDRGLGLFAGLNVLPKSGTLSSYSYRIVRSMNRKLLLSLSNIFKDDDSEQGEFNLDFKTIPHWGDESVLEKNWSGARSRGLKSVLSLLVQDPDTGFISYSDAEIRHRNESDAVLEFVDFWKKGRGVAPKMLIFDSKFTTYQNLNRLDKSEEKIKFLTLRRRGKNLLEQAGKILDSEWQTVTVESAKGKPRKLKVHDSNIQLRHYEGPIRQLILTDHGRLRPTFMISNDFDLSRKQLISKYARRWLVEQEIAEQVDFFHMNSLSSSIVVKVDFDLTISLLAHNLYKVLTKQLPGFERRTVKRVERDFLRNGAKVQIRDKRIEVGLKKKSHLPILFELPWMKNETNLSWMKASIKFTTATTS